MLWYRMFLRTKIYGKFHWHYDTLKKSLSKSKIWCIYHKQKEEKFISVIH